jgi:hypothetical protein
MSWHSCLNKRFSSLLIPACLVISCSLMQADPLTIVSTASFNGTNYVYDFSITNNSSADPMAYLISVDFTLPVGSLVGSPTAPAGNGAVADPGAGFVEFSSNNLTGFPSGTAVDGFHFTTSSFLSSLPFVANYLNTAQTAVTPFDGTTVPRQTPTVPEPSTVGLITGAGLLLLTRVRALCRR